MKRLRGCLRFGCLSFVVLMVIGGIGALITNETESATATAQAIRAGTRDAARAETRIAQAATASIIALTPTDTPTITLTASQTLTPSSTFTPTDTLSPTPTLTLTKSSTPTATLTPTITRTPTATIPPATLTAEVRAANASATAQERQSQQTQAAADRTSTAEVLFDNRTATAEYRSDQATLQAGYKRLDYREIRDKADAHLGEYVIVRGRVFNINGKDEFQMYFAGTYDDVYIKLRYYIPDGIYENSNVTVYAMVYGYSTGTNAFGAEVRFPVLIDGMILIDGYLQ